MRATLSGFFVWQNVSFATSVRISRKKGSVGDTGVDGVNQSAARSWQKTRQVSDRQDDVKADLV